MMRKHLIKKLIVKFDLLRLALLLSRNKVVILRYHSVLDNNDALKFTIGEEIVHSASIFDEQMRLLASLFNPVTLDDLYLFVRGKMKLPKMPVVITFDDGFSDNEQIAAPILQKYGIKATFFITVGSIETETAPWFARIRQAFHLTIKSDWREPSTGTQFDLVDPLLKRQAFIKACEQCAKTTGSKQANIVRTIEEALGVLPLGMDKNLMMDWRQIRRLQKQGHIIGSHTLTHPNLAHISEVELIRELKESKRVLESRLGVSVVHFSYPAPILAPHYTLKTIKSTKEIGYKTGVTSVSGPVNRNDSILSLNRISVPQDRDDFLWNIYLTLNGFRV